MPNSAITCLICFAKAPVKGTAKTRLAADIGIDAAHAVYLELLQRSATCIDAWPYQKQICYTGDYANFKDSCLARFAHFEQNTGDLGTRLLNGAQTALASSNVILIGTDCPQINCAALLEIHHALADHDVVFGPATDGGYWAIGLRNQAAAELCLSADLPWSQENLRSVTESRLDQHGLSYCSTQTYNDIDTVGDLEQAQKRGFPSLGELSQA